jgi:hypothetical protein
MIRRKLASNKVKVKNWPPAPNARLSHYGQIITRSMTISGRGGPHNLWSTATTQHQSKAHIFKNPAAVNCDKHGCTTELAG